MGPGAPSELLRTIRDGCWRVQAVSRRRRHLTRQLLAIRLFPSCRRAV